MSDPIVVARVRALQPAEGDDARRREMRAECGVRKTAPREWRIIHIPSGLKVSGPRLSFDHPLLGPTLIMGPSTWKTEAEARAALAQLREQSGDDEESPKGLRIADLLKTR